MDIAPYTFASNWERYQIFDITHPVIFQDYFLLFAEPGEESPLLIVTKPFRYEVTQLQCSDHVARILQQTLELDTRPLGLDVHRGRCHLLARICPRRQTIGSKTPPQPAG